MCVSLVLSPVALSLKRKKRQQKECKKRERERGREDTGQSFLAAMDSTSTSASNKRSIVGCEPSTKPVLMFASGTSEN